MYGGRGDSFPPVLVNEESGRLASGCEWLKLETESEGDLVLSIN